MSEITAFRRRKYNASERHESEMLGAIDASREKTQRRRGGVENREQGRNGSIYELNTDQIRKLLKKNDKGSSGKLERQDEINRMEEKEADAGHLTANDQNIYKLDNLPLREPMRHGLRKLSSEYVSRQFRKESRKDRENFHARRSRQRPGISINRGDQGPLQRKITRDLASDVGVLTKSERRKTITRKKDAGKEWDRLFERE